MFTKFCLTTSFILFIGLTGYTQSIDTKRSIASFEISNMKINAVNGTVKGMTGHIAFDPDNLEICDFDVCMDATTINTDNSKRDEHLQQQEYFNTELFNDICFVSREIRNAEQDGFAVIGSLTMTDVSKDVMIPFTFDGSTFTGQLKISRYDYNIGTDVGKFMIGEQVNITITCHLDKS